MVKAGCWSQEQFGANSSEYLLLFFLKHRSVYIFQDKKSQIFFAAHTTGETNYNQVYRNESLILTGPVLPQRQINTQEGALLEYNPRSDYGVWLFMWQAYFSEEQG